MKEIIIKKAIEGKYMSETGLSFEALFRDLSNNADWKHIVMEREFWEALGIGCGWKEGMFDPVGGHGYDGLSREEWLYNALRFHEINLMKGWGKAVAYLGELAGNN